MAVSDARKRANARYDAKNCKYQTVKMPLAEHRRLAAYCKTAGLPLNGFVRAAIIAALDADGAPPAPPEEPDEK